MSEQQADAADSSENTEVQDTSSEAPQESGSFEEGAEKAQAKAENFLGDDALDKMVKVKIDGEEHQMTVREALKLQSLEKASRSRMEQASKLQKQVQQFIEWAKHNPDQFLSETGIDPDEFAEARLAKKYEMMQMSPEQKELMETKQRLAQYEAKEQELKAHAEKEELSKQEQAMMNDIQTQFVDAWKESGLPVDPYFGAQVAYEMLAAARRKQDLPAKAAADIVKEKFFKQTSSIISKLTPEQIRQVLGDVGLKTLKEDDIKRATDSQAASMGLKKENRPAGPAASKRKSKKYLNENEWREWAQSLADA